MSRFRLDLTQLYKNETYTDALAHLLNRTLPLWMKENHAYPQQVKRVRARGKHYEPRLFGRFYTDNFQLRSLAGCSSGECLDDVRLAADEKEGLRRGLRSAPLPANATAACTQYFVTEALLFDPCGKLHTAECPRGCEAPCFHAAAATGPVGPQHLARATAALAAFDAVLVTDRWDDARQSDFLADVAGVPREAPYTVKRAEGQNRGVATRGGRQRRYFYRDLLRRLGLRRIADALNRENRLELQLFDHARRLNGRMLEAWENETAGWDRTGDAAVDTDEGRAPPGESAGSGDDARPPSDSRAKDGHVSTGGEEPTDTDEDVEEAGADGGRSRAQPMPRSIRGNGGKTYPIATARDTDEAHQYGVLFVMYHKTGYVLTRYLTKEILQLEIRARGYAKGEVPVNLSGYAMEYVDERKGATLAFGRRGGWNAMVTKPRKHHGVLGCGADFRLSAGKIHLQEAPTLYCGDADLSARMLGLPARPPDAGGRAKIAHFVRNPFDMALSNYFYHSQEIVVEPWVHKDDPCEANYSNGESLASLVLPLISRQTKITAPQLDAVVSMCQSLFRSEHAMENATFYEHLMQLNHWDGLQLATAQMVISSSSANGNLAGGDLLRMAHGILKFRDLQTSPSIPIAQRENTHVLTLAMEDYLASPENVTANLIEFVLGSNDTVVPRDLRMDAARDYAARVAAAGRKKNPART